MVAGAPAAQAATAPAAAVPARAAAASSVREVLGSGRKNAVALTIDDGPHPTWTPKVLDLLAASGVRATFSLVGEQAQAYPKLVRRIARAGHGLCNHSMTHTIRSAPAAPPPFGVRSATRSRPSPTPRGRSQSCSGRRGVTGRRRCSTAPRSTG